MDTLKEQIKVSFQNFCAETYIDVLVVGTAFTTDADLRGSSCCRAGGGSKPAPDCCEVYV